MSNLSGATTAVFTITLSAALETPVTATWETKDGTAKAGKDYEAAKGSVTFAPGETTKQIQVVVYGVEQAGAENLTFSIVIYPPENAILDQTLNDVEIHVSDDSGTVLTSLVVATGPRGLKGDPGLSSYALAKLQGFTGTLEEWIQKETAAGDAADRAEQAADTAELAVLQLPTKQQFVEIQVKVNSLTADPLNSVTDITIPAKDFDAVIGSPTYGSVASRLFGWQFPHGTKCSVSKMIDLPSHWTKMRIKFVWVNLTAYTGNISISGESNNWTYGESINQTPAGGSTVVAVDATPNIAKESEIPLDITVDTTKHMTLRVTRNGDSASDTLLNSFALLAVRLTKVA